MVVTLFIVKGKKKVIHCSIPDSDSTFQEKSRKKYSMATDLSLWFKKRNMAFILIPTQMKKKTDLDPTKILGS